MLLAVAMAGPVAAQEASLSDRDDREPIFVALEDLQSMDGGGLRYPDEPPADYIDSMPAGDCCCSEYWGWTVLPVGILYKSYLADVHQSRLAAHVSHVSDHVDESGMMFDGTLGGRKGLLRYGNRNPFRPEGFQIDVDAAAQVRLSFEEEMDVQATDYRVGVPLTYGWGNTQIKFGYWHVSSHLGDEFLLKNFGYPRLNYAKDSLMFGYSHYLTDDFRVYGEASWAFWSDIAEPWEFQFGAEHAPMCPTGICGAPFAAMNVQLRQEVNFGGSFTAQTGWCWRGEAGGLLRLGVHYYNGESSQLSFHDEFERQIGIAIWYDY